MKNAQFIAHRGLSGNFPENTHVAFNAAWAADFDGIELDIQVTKDDTVIVIHDPDTARTAGEKHLIKETHWADLQHLDVGQGGKGGSDRFYEKIPLLSDVIERMPAGKIIQIEMKHQIDNMNAVLSQLSQLREDISAQIISFDADKLLQVRQQLPHLDCFLIIDKYSTAIDNPIKFATTHGLRGLDMHYPLITDAFAQQMQDNQLQIACWTVNNTNTAKQLMKKGTQFIAGDYADNLIHRKSENLKK